MASFLYRAIGPSGVESGNITAHDRNEALKVLDGRGLQPVSLKEQGGKAPPVNRAKHKRSEAAGVAADGRLKLKRTDVVLFTEELSEMLAAGLQLEPALRSMENRQELGNLKEVSTRLRQQVCDGNNFSTALKNVSDSFGSLYCSLAAAGEASGALPTILRRQAHYLKTLQELQTKIRLALIYPAFLILSGVAVAIIFVTKLIPQLTSLIESTPGGKIPGGAAFLISVSDFFQAWWHVAVIAIVVGVVAFKVWKSKEENQPTWDRVKLDLPLYGSVVESRFYVQFLETLANLVGNGLPLLRSLELTRDATLNLHIRQHLNTVIDMVGEGRSFSRSLVKVGMFPALLVDMVSVGEQTGRIDDALRRAADRYDRELNNSLQRLMALVMPAVLIVMAILIGAMAYLMITAIFQTIHSLGGK